MFVTHKRFAVLFLLSCCVNSLIFQTEDLNYTGIRKRLMAGYEALAEEFKPIRNKEMFKMNMN